MAGLRNRVVMIAWEPLRRRGVVLLHRRGRPERDGLREGQLDLAQQVAAHLVAGGVVEPVEEPPAGGGLAEPLVGLEAGPGEELLDLADRVEPLALPPAEPEGAGGLDRPVLDAHERGRGGGGPLREAGVVA